MIGLFLAGFFSFVLPLRYCRCVSPSQFREYKNVAGNAKPVSEISHEETEDRSLSGYSVQRSKKYKH